MRNGSLFSVAASCLFLSASLHETQIPTLGAMEPPAIRSAPIDGIWEQISHQFRKEKPRTLDETQFRNSRALRIIQGGECYLIYPGFEMQIIPEQVRIFGADKEIEFFRVETETIHRYSFQLPESGFLEIQAPAFSRLAKIGKENTAIDRYKRLPEPKRVTVAGAPIGIWKTATLERNGEKLEPCDFPDNSVGLEEIADFARRRRAFVQDHRVLCFRGELCAIISNMDGNDIIQKPFRINAAKNEIDFLDQNDKLIPAIIQQKGDRMMICWNDQGGERPTEFRTQPADGRLLLNLVRVDKEKLKREKVPLKRTAPPDELRGVWFQTSAKDSIGDIAARNRLDFRFHQQLLIYDGKHSYWIKRGTTGFWIDLCQIYGLGSGAIEAVDSESNRTVRCLVKFNKNELLVCHHKNNYTAKLAERWDPVPEDFVVRTFKRLSSPKEKMSLHERTPPGSILGLWETVGYEVDGKRLEDQVDPRRYGECKKLFLFQEKSFTQIGNHESALVTSHNPYRIHVVDGKQAIDFEENVPVRGIYRFDGHDLILCFNYVGGERPDDFRTQDGDKRVVLRLRRVDEAK